MILYLDTSSIIKLYVEEEGSPSTHDLVAGAEVVSTSAVAYVEMRSALARKHRRSEVQLAEYRRLLEQVEREWPLYAIIPVTQQVVTGAGVLAERHALRALDALHLASATVLARRSAQPLAFLSADAVLLQAAALEGLGTLAP